MKAIRNLYAQLGVDAYYQQYGYQYQNPHLEQIAVLLKKNQARLDYRQVLDFCAGGGEVSLILKNLGFPNSKGSDPYLRELYQKNTGQACYDWSFESAVKQGIVGQYSCIVCSFALHLCPSELLYALVVQLFQHSSMLVILTPHKRPALEQYEGVSLAFSDHALTAKGKKVHLKAYQYAY
jgi:hypothetical protein